MPILPETAVSDVAVKLKNAPGSLVEIYNIPVATDINPAPVTYAPIYTETEDISLYPALLPPARYPALEAPGRYPAVEEPGHYPAVEHPANLQRRAWADWKNSASRFWNAVTSYNVFGTEPTPDPIPATTSVYDTTLIPIDRPPKELYTPDAAQDFNFPATINDNLKYEDVGLTANPWNDQLSRPYSGKDSSIPSMPEMASPWSAREKITPGNLDIANVPIEDRYFAEENPWRTTKSQGWQQNPKVVAPYAPGDEPMPEMQDLHIFNLPALIHGSSASSSGSSSPNLIPSTPTWTDSMSALGRDIVAAEETGYNEEQAQIFQDRLNKLMTARPGAGVGALPRAGNRAYPVMAKRDIEPQVAPVHSLDWVAPSTVPTIAPAVATSSAGMMQGPERMIMFVMIMFCLFFGRFFGRR